MFHVSIHDSTWYFIFNLSKFLHSSLGSTRSYPRIHHTGQECHGAHDRVTTAGEGNGLVSKGTQCSSTTLRVLQVWIFYRQPQEVKDAFILSPGSHVLAHLVPVVLVHLQRLQQ